MHEQQLKKKDDLGFLEYTVKNMEQLNSISDCS